MAAALFGMGLTLLSSPGAIHASKFHFMLDLISPFVLMFFYFIVGGVRLSALWINSDWPSGSSLMRSAGAIGGAMVWAQMAMSLLISQSAASTLPPSIPLYSSLVAAELYSAYRAASDVRLR